MTADTPNLDRLVTGDRTCSSDVFYEARAELAALKARVEAAEGLLREVSEFIDTESRVVKALAERAQQIAGRIDAALQAAREA